MPTYTAWPIEADITATIAAIGVTLRAGQNSAYITRQLLALAQQVKKQTRRQFVVSGSVQSPETRYFDGSGTGQMEIDEYRSIDSVTLLNFGALSGTVAMANVHEVEQNILPKTRLYIYQSSLPAFSRVYIDSFPRGRANIQVDGIWGYDDTIPADLWEAFAKEASARLAAEAIFNTNGRLESWSEADVSEKYMLQLPGEAAGWHQGFVDAIKSYKRPFQVHANRTKRQMV
ncbi:MAG TPA: hypothetical protein VJQ25_03945 [Nitrospira sp.]|nr:hypothetical protein [Nitrospira sp.]